MQIVAYVVLNSKLAVYVMGFKILKLFYGDNDGDGCPFSSSRRRHRMKWNILPHSTNSIKRVRTYSIKMKQNYSLFKL